MSSVFVLLASALISLPHPTGELFSSQELSLTSSAVGSLRTGLIDTKKQQGREVVVEVPGITCVTRFTDSLRQHVVDRIDGVNGIAFEYLPRDQAHPFDERLKQAIKEGKMFFGGWGRLTFQVDASFDDDVLLRKLLESKLYANTELWLLIQRKPLSELELGK